MLATLLLYCITVGNDSIATFRADRVFILSRNGEIEKVSVPQQSKILQVEVKRDEPNTTIFTSWVGTEHDGDAVRVVTVWFNGENTTVLVMNYGRSIELYGKSLKKGDAALVDFEKSKILKIMSFDSGELITEFSAQMPDLGRPWMTTYSYLPPKIDPAEVAGDWENAAKAHAFFYRGQGSIVLPSLTGPWPKRPGNEDR